MFEKLKQKLAMKRMSFGPVTDPALSAYLQPFHCEKCQNHCSLAYIRCGGGLEAREIKIKEWKQK